MTKLLQWRGLKFRITLYDPINQIIRKHVTRDPEKAAELFYRIGKRIDKRDAGSGLILHRIKLTQGTKTLQTLDAEGLKIMAPMAVEIDWPWCEVCKSYHHPLNPTCFKITRRKISPPDEDIVKRVHRILGEPS